MQFCKCLGSQKYVIEFHLVKRAADDWHGYFADSMMKFASFETIVELLCKYAIPTPREQCSKPLQLGVSFAGEYWGWCILWIFAIVLLLTMWSLISTMERGRMWVMWVNCTHGFCLSAHSVFPHAHLCCCFNVPCVAGCEEARVMGSFHSWPSSSYSHDWNSYWSPVWYKVLVGLQVFFTLHIFWARSLNAEFPI